MKLLNFLFPDGTKLTSLEKENEKLRKDCNTNVGIIRNLADGCPSNPTEKVPDFVFDYTQVKHITESELRSKLKSIFPRAEIKLADNLYQYTTLAEVQRWASFDPTNELKYRADELDCDKFALTDMAAFKSENNYQFGNGVFGICWGNAKGIGSHAWNIAYVEEGIIMCEPQSDKIWKYADNQDYVPDFIYI